MGDHGAHGAGPSDTVHALLEYQRLVLDARDEATLARSVVAVAGLGGIGAPAVEILARNAVSHFRLADLDRYDTTNARQLFMTQETVGREKVEVARERVLAIHPEAEVELFPHGITPSSWAAFARGADVVCCQVDQLASILMLHHAGERLRLPVVSAGRASWPERHRCGVTVTDYRRPEVRLEDRLATVEDRWGVDEPLVRELMDHVRRERDCPELVAAVNEQNHRFRIHRMLETLTAGDPRAVGDKPRAHLLEQASRHPERFHKMAVSPEEAVLMGVLAGTAVKDLLLGRRPAAVQVDLYSGWAGRPEAEAEAEKPIVAGTLTALG